MQLFFVGMPESCHLNDVREDWGRFRSLLPGFFKHSRIMPSRQRLEAFT